MNARSLARWSVAALCMFITDGAFAAMPQGAYYQTCTGAVVGADNVLKAKCKTRAGATVDSSLKLPCNGNVENMDGKLTCVPLPPPTPETAPPGPYLQSCTGATVSADYALQARCKNASGVGITAGIKLPCNGSVENVGGSLQCANASRNPVPPGTYLLTCGETRLSNDVLTAKCRQGNQVLDSSMNMPCSGKIENVSGRLACVGALAGVDFTVTNRTAYYVAFHVSRDDAKAKRYLKEGCLEPGKVQAFILPGEDRYRVTVEAFRKPPCGPDEVQVRGEFQATTKNGKASTTILPAISLSE